MNSYAILKKQALETLETRLSPDLYYHGVEHTFDVLHVVEQYIERKAIEAHNAYLLRLGALFHDIGFIVSNEDHETYSAAIARRHMEALDCDERDIRVVEGLIAATRIPQQPKTELEEIICDADLDYLGRDDFWEISESLFKELKAYGKVSATLDWNKLQIAFLEKHQYHTDYAIKNRQPKKEQRIKELKEMVAKDLRES